MIYTIEETNLRRQHLLADVLEPISLHALKDFSLPGNANILDIGCGLGDTTMMLNRRFPNSAITGIDGDTSLIDVATDETRSRYPNLNFICADALHLPFDDNSFDLVFTRYCLHHLVSAQDGLKEMKRVCKPGGIVFAQEPDINAIVSYPESRACTKHNEYIKLLFADALVGRKLISYFKQLQLHGIGRNIGSVIGDESNSLKTFIAMTSVAIGEALLKNKLATKDEHQVLVMELKSIQDDPNVIIIMPPSIAVWGTK